MQSSNALYVMPEQSLIPTPTLPYEFISAAMEDPKRINLETFVQEGFAKKYQANVTNFMPLLLGIHAQRLRAVVGVRRATQPLFIEQYLPVPITNMLQKHGVWTQRHAIAELGNLYSQNQRFTLPLLMTVVMSLYLSEIQYLVFSGTDKIRQLLEKLKLKLTFLADADPSKLQDQANWGNYYTSQPKVMFIDVAKAVATALMQPELQALFGLVQANHSALLQQMRTL